jgi:hypothetical protein
VQLPAVFWAGKCLFAFIWAIPHIHRDDGRRPTAMKTDFIAPIDPVARERWLDELVRLSEGAKLRGTSKATLIRQGHAGKIKLYPVGERALAVRRRDALMLE